MSRAPDVPPRRIRTFGCAVTSAYPAAPSHLFRGVRCRRTALWSQIWSQAQWIAAAPCLPVPSRRLARPDRAEVGAPSPRQDCRVPRWAGPGALCARLGVYRFRHFAAAADVLCFTGHAPCRKPGAPPDDARRLVFRDRCTPYTALSTGCIARRALLITFGVTARFTPRTGCIARRTERGTNKRLKKPMNDRSAAATRTLQTRSSDLFVPKVDTSAHRLTSCIVACCLSCAFMLTRVWGVMGARVPFAPGLLRQPRWSSCVIPLHPEGQLAQRGRFPVLKFDCRHSPEAAVVRLPAGLGHPVSSNQPSRGAALRCLPWTQQLRQFWEH